MAKKDIAIGYRASQQMKTRSLQKEEEEEQKDFVKGSE